MNSEHATQARVGAFLLIGLVLAAAMVVYFGRFGDGLKKFYNIRVEYPNASGLFSGADVLLAGARVGAVQDGPYVLDSMRGVYVMLKIYEGVLIPEGSTFTIGSSGLLGDSFVDITMPVDLDAKKFVPMKPDTVVTGKREMGMGDLAGEGTQLIADIRAAVSNVNVMVTKLNTEVLNQSTVESVGKTVKNIEATSQEFSTASKRLDDMLTEAEVAVKEATDALGRVSKTVDKSTDTLEAARLAAVSFDKTMVDVRNLLRDIRQGNGPIGTLISDKGMADNLRALVVNLRKHGILWYKDRAAEQGAPTP
jgi:ABC-type transporter Mla subunit MlaD